VSWIISLVVIVWSMIFLGRGRSWGKIRGCQNINTWIGGQRKNIVFFWYILMFILKSLCNFHKHASYV